jgi:DNA-directed RNA polymerase III subunit RPC1
MVSTKGCGGDGKKIVGQSSAPKKISQIQFGTLDSAEIQKVAEVRVANRTIFSPPSAQNPQRHPATDGCMDPRMGVSGKSNPDKCETCGKNLANCAGHFGYIQLELPVFHAGFFKHTLTILQCICKRCSKVMLSTQERDEIRARLHNGSNKGALFKAQQFKKVVDSCKSTYRCPSCGYSNGVVKKVGGAFFKIVHEKYRSKNMPESFLNLHDNNMEKIRNDHPELKLYTKNIDLLNPMRAYELLSRIPEEDYELLWMNGEFSTPDTLVMWSVPVPPVPIRPSVPQDMGGGSTEDDITITLQQVVEMNNALKLALDRGASMKMVAEDWEYLQIQVALFINGETPGIPRAMMGARASRGLCQRLKGKQGRFRGNLSGKRVDFSGRTVISPDPNLKIDQVGVPELVAKVMTYPERVNNHNIERLRKAVLNGMEQHPGANMVRTESGMVLALGFANRENVASRLAVGDVVERHMHDDDIVLFNRQPSLHKMSIMSHRVKVMPWRTFRFNECACTPYNADFDGDEMNMHLPQTEEARVEASELMSIAKNLVTPRNGEPLVAATQDFITGAYLLTKRDVFFSRDEFCRIVAFLSDALEEVDLPLPAIIKPRALWTGKQLFSLLVRPNKDVDSFVNVQCQEKFYTKNEHFCVMDGYVSFRGGEHISGNLGKKTLGSDNKTGLFYVLIRDFGVEETCRCMSRLAKLSARFMGERGFSIGIEDVTPSKIMLDIKAKTLKNGQLQAEREIDAYKSGQIKLKPGCDALQSLESEVNGLLGKIREACGQAALGALDYRNAPLCMAQCGSKGSPLNISQMVACLGQQSVGGARIQDGFVGRTLPHFPVDALFPAAKGFVANSFFSGLTATEFFFHTMGGREGLVDTAVKTAETGYMARRLMKALEDLSMQYDNTIRNSEQTVVQFSYGDDGLNPNVMEQGDRPVEFNRLSTNICLNKHRYQDNVMDCETNLSLGGEYGKILAKDSEDEPLTSDELKKVIDDELDIEPFKSMRDELHIANRFWNEIKDFFYAFSSKLKAIEGTNFTKLSKSKSKSKSKNDDDSNYEKMSSLRLRLSKMTNQEKDKWVLDVKKNIEPASNDSVRLLCDNTLRMTLKQVKMILAGALYRYNVSIVQPGEAVGAVGAQSLSEPGTQMTLKTFHFAGVASMNVTLGVPRLKEIINSSKHISTPIIEARLIQNHNSISARIVKANIEKTLLGDIALYMKEVHCSNGSYISIKLDTETIRKLHLNVNASTVRSAILASTLDSDIRSTVLRSLKDRHVYTVGSNNDRLRIIPPEPKETKSKNSDVNTVLHTDRKILFMTQALRTALPHVIVQGYNSVSRAVINEEIDSDNLKSYYLLVEGYGLREVMGSTGVDGLNTKSNHIMDMQDVLGIEAARSVISSEISFIMKSYGITVDRRHLMLLSDVMTFKGEVLGITRFGVAKMRESVLMLASFEKTTDHLFDAAVHAREDAIVGVSECIIMGVPIPIGTGLFKLLHKAKSAVQIKPRKTLLQTSIASNK